LNGVASVHNVHSNIDFVIKYHIGSQTSNWWSNLELMIKFQIDGQISNWWSNTILVVKPQIDGQISNWWSNFKLMVISNWWSNLELMIKSQIYGQIYRFVFLVNYWKICIETTYMTFLFFIDFTWTSWEDLNLPMAFSKAVPKE